MNELSNIANNLQKLHAEMRSWRKAGAVYGIDPASARMIANGYEPGPKLRKKLDIMPTVEVIVVGDAEIPPGIQIVCSFSRCKCGRQFFTTSGRKNCYLCRAWKGKR